MITKTLKFSNGTVNISAVQIGVVVRDSQSLTERFGHIVGFCKMQLINEIGVIVKWHNSKVAVNESIEFLDILL